MNQASALRIDRLKAAREQRGWSQRELARMCRLGEAQVGKYESGRTDPTATSLKIIADTLNVSVDYLLGGSDDPRRRIDSPLGEEEYELRDMFRHEGWRGVARLSVEKVTRQENP